MARAKIDYGIDLGTTNSAIVRMDAGEAVPIRSDVLKDTMPSCVGYNKKKSPVIGDSAANGYRSATLKALKTLSEDPNFFTEFKRTMGTDKLHTSANMSASYSSEELSAEVLKKLKSFVSDDDVTAAVITVPAKFTINQKDATLRAATLAGMEHCELLQEPIAAAMAYGLGVAEKNGTWLTFDLGGGTFDAAVLSVSEGIIKVIDTEGDNYLGGKNIDDAIVDEILIPHLAAEYSIDSFLDRPDKRDYFRRALKCFAEPAKIQLSFSDHVDILSDLGELGGDDNGEEMIIDLTLTREMLRTAESPVFEKAVDLSLSLLARKGLTGRDLTALILIGGPTYSPNLREMVAKQITGRVDTSVDPMTAVAKGAALYASTLDRPEHLVDSTRDRTKIQLGLGYKPTSVDDRELLSIRILKDKSDGEIPDRVFVEVVRSNGGWSSDRFAIDDKGEIVECFLEDGRANNFTVNLYDESGNRLFGEPTEFTILQGLDPGKATLAYSMGIEIKQKFTGKLVFQSLQGLSRNQSYPANGVKNGLKTQQGIGPGSGANSIKIPLYQGEEGADGSRALHNEHVYDAVISGDDLPAFLPKNSDIDLTVRVNSDREITISAYFPLLDHTHEIPVPVDTVQEDVSAEWLNTEIVRARQSVDNLHNRGIDDVSEETEIISESLRDLKISLEQGQNDYDRKRQVLTNLRRVLKEIEKLEDDTEWPATEERLKDRFYRVERYWEENLNDFKGLNNARVSASIASWKQDIPKIIEEKDVRLALEQIDKIDSLYYVLTDDLIGVRLYIQWIHEYDEEFNDHPWSDRAKARLLINQGLSLSAGNPTKEGLRSLIYELNSMLPDRDKKIFDGDESLLSDQ